MHAARRATDGIGLLVSLLNLSLSSALILASGAAFAEGDSDSSSKLRLPVEAAPSDAALSSKTSTILGQKKFEESHTLTDSKLRADDGSLSHYSAKGNLSYYGPTLGNLEAADQPNLDGAVGNFAQAIKGSVMARYRIDSDSTISAGTGISFNHPFHGLDRTDANNPFVAYDMATRFAGIQMRNSPGVTIATIPNYTAVGEFGGLTWDNSLVYNLGHSRFALGLDTNVSYWLFNRTYRSGPTKKGGDGLATQYTAQISPLVKYNFTDSFNMYSSVGMQIYNPRMTSDQSVIWSRTPTLRVGMGYAIGRDVYFAPYLQGYLSNLAADMTSINVATIFSLL